MEVAAATPAVTNMLSVTAKPSDDPAAKLPLGWWAKHDEVRGAFYFFHGKKIPLFLRFLSVLH